ncbi:PRC-barrel domain-containing protein [Phycisphaeraceae bacterium D3-23]
MLSAVMMDHKHKAAASCREKKQNDCQERYRFINKTGRPIISAASLRGLPVRNDDGHDLGVLKELMVDTDRGTVAYVVLLFEDDKSFALPYSALEIDPETMTIYVNIQREVFEAGRGMALPEQKDKP